MTAITLSPTIFFALSAVLRMLYYDTPVMDIFRRDMLWGPRSELYRCVIDLRR